MIETVNGRCEVSVVVATYNSDIEKLLYTLHSITVQTGITFQIVVTDDGSKIKQGKKIRDFFKTVGFADYVILEKEENKGTTQNFLDGVSAASGKYIKAISPGDYLYDCNVLRELYDFSELHKAAVCYSSANYYAGDVLTNNRANHPRRIDLYEKSERAQQTEYLIYDDVPLGATYFFEREAIKKYLEIVKGRIIYAEDYTVGLMVAEGIPLHYYEGQTIWYESDTGISVRTNPVWAKRLLDDLYAMHDIISERIRFAPDKRFIKLQDRIFCARKIKNHLIRNIVKIIIYPPYLSGMFRRRKELKANFKVENTDALKAIKQFDVTRWK